MKFGKTRRRESALERRRVNVLLYERILQDRIPLSLYGKEYTDQSEWHEVVLRKLDIARKQVDILVKKLGIEE